MFLTKKKRIRRYLDTVPEPVRDAFDLLLADYLGFEFVDAAELICFHSDGTYDDETTLKWTQKLEDMKAEMAQGVAEKDKAMQAKVAEL